jgi:hypothetical protein
VPRDRGIQSFHELGGRSAGVVVDHDHLDLHTLGKLESAEALEQPCDPLRSAIGSDADRDVRVARAQKAPLRERTAPTVRSRIDRSRDRERLRM